MRRLHIAIVALCVLVALGVATFGSAALSTALDADATPAASGPESAEPSATRLSALATRDDDAPSWQLSPPWATHPEILLGSERFERLAERGAPTPGERPNIVLITTDDQNANEMRWMPKTRALIGNPGTRFSEAISPHPLCCPARAMTLTGQFAQNNGVRSNFWPSGGYYQLESENTLPVWLRQAGYETAFLGKYLNEYGMLDPEEVPDGWDHWRAPVKRGVYDYYDYTMNEDGELTPYRGVYQTDYYAEQTEKLIASMSEDDDPFFLWQSHLAPHTACPVGANSAPCWDLPTPAATYNGMYDDLPLPQAGKPSYNEQDVSDKPRAIADREPLGPDAHQHLTELFQRRVESLQSVDDTVARTVDALAEAGELDDTLIIFTSDNGYLLGEHRYQGKILGYEPALRVPLLLRGPAVPPGASNHETVATVDLAPTIAALAEARPTVETDGRNLAPVIGGRAPGWETVLVQGGPRVAQEGDEWLYRGVRTGRYTYLEYRRTGEVELYDRKADPLQLTSLAEDPAYSEVRSELSRRLTVLQDCSGRQCRARFGPVGAPAGASATP